MTLPSDITHNVAYIRTELDTLSSGELRFYLSGLDGLRDGNEFTDIALGFLRDMATVALRKALAREGMS